MTEKGGERREIRDNQPKESVCGILRKTVLLGEFGGMNLLEWKADKVFLKTRILLIVMIKGY